MRKRNVQEDMLVASHHEPRDQKYSLLFGGAAVPNDQRRPVGFQFALSREAVLASFATHCDRE